jgi:hypothetical protein
LGDETGSELIKISEEFGDSDSLLLAELSEFGNDIFTVFRAISLDVGSSNSWASLWVVVEGVVITSADSKELLG